MASNTIGDFRARRKVTGRLFWADYNSSTQFNDMGNVEMIKVNPKVNRAQMKTAQKGYTQITHEEPSDVDWRYQIKLDEHANTALQILSLSTAVSTVSQSSASGSSWSIGSASPGYSYYVGAVGLTAFTMSTYTLNTDYTIDLGSGMLTILASGSIGASTSLSGTLTCPAESFLQATVLTQTFWRGYARIHTFDQNTSIPREIVTFQGEIAVTDWGEHDGEKWNAFQVELLATTAPVVQSIVISP